MRLAFLAILVALATAGCTVFGPGGGNTHVTSTPSTTSTPTMTTTITTPTTSTTPVTTTPTVTTPSGIPANSYTLTLTGVPEIIETGVAFPVTVTVTGATPRTADTITVRWGPTTASTASMTVYANDCGTVSVTVPGTANFTCTMNGTAPFTAYLRAYARVGGTEFWSNESAMPVRAPVGTFTVTSPNATSVPAGNAKLPPAQSGQDYLILLNVTGNGTEQARNITIDIRTCSNGVNGCEDDVKICSRGAGEVPGSFYVVCRFTNVAQYELTGHAEVVVGPTVHVFAGPKMDLTVVGAPIPI